MRAADALFAQPASRRPAETAAPVPAPSPESKEPARQGRILQAIDETPANPFAALEAAHAPKRRGRKPGSKNKPKPQVDTLPVARVPGEAPSRRKAKPIPAPEPVAPIRTAALVAAPPDTVRQTERFAWVRTSLRPGERWKRRLPKVAW